MIRIVALRDRSIICLARGRGSGFFAGAAVIGVLAVAFPAGMTVTGQAPPWENVQRIWLIVAGILAVLTAVGVYHSAKRLVLTAGSLHITGLLAEQYVSVDELSAMTIQTLGCGGEHHFTSDYLTLWCGEHIAARFDLRTWNRDDLARVVENLMSPIVQVAPEVYRALGIPLLPLSSRNAVAAK